MAMSRYEENLREKTGTSMDVDMGMLAAKAGVAPGAHVDTAAAIIRDYQKGNGQHSPYASLNPDNPNNPVGPHSGEGLGGDIVDGLVWIARRKRFWKVVKWILIIYAPFFVLSNLILHFGGIEWLEANMSPETEQWLWEKTKWLRGD